MPTAVHSIEMQRLEEQRRLDGLKTPLERNKWGQFATPPELALSLACHARGFMPPDQALRFLDPAIGTGSFFSAFLHDTPAARIAGATGVELDPLFAKAARELWGNAGLQMLEGDFTRQPPPAQRFNFVLTNPPYVRHHHLTLADKERLKERLARSLQLEISGLAGLYCYFLLLCHDWMEEDGLAVWLIPSEFMDVNYGSTLRRYLTERVTLLHIHRFCPATDAQFTDALVSSAVVIFRKSPPPPGHAARFSFGGQIDHPRSEAPVFLDVLKHSHKWTQFPGRTTNDAPGELTLGDIFTIKRGIATGSNGFFILTEDQAKDWEIPRAYLKPILPSPRYLTEQIVEARLGGAPDVTPRLYLLDCNQPEDYIKQRWPRFYEYLEQGKAALIPAQYLTSRRAPWYSQEQRPPAPFLCTYMGRARNGKPPFRFIWNRSEATAHNVYLMLYPKASLNAALRQSPELAARVFEALQRTTSAQFISEGRVYGGGLHKVEPKELGQIPAQEILATFGDQAPAFQERLFG